MTQPYQWLDDGEVLLHIGVHKTGTTALQGALAAARPALEAQGVRYPSETISHFHAAFAAIGKRRGWELGGQVPSSRRWEELQAEVAATTTGRIVISAETFCEANDEQAADIVARLGGSRVKVVITLRPLEKLIPSGWQEFVKGGLDVSYEEWLADIMRGPAAGKKITPAFWKRNDHGALVERWASVVGADRVLVVVVDSRDPDGIFRTFETVIGLQQHTLVAAESVASNRSLSREEVELLRRLNADIGKGIDWRTYNRLVRQGGMKRLVEGRRPGPDETVLVVPAPVVEYAREHGRSAIERIGRSGVRTIGELHLLTPTDAVQESAGAEAPTSVPVDAAALLLRGVLDAAIESAAKKKRGRRVPAEEVTGNNPTGFRDRILHLRRRFVPR